MNSRLKIFVVLFFCAVMILSAAEQRFPISGKMPLALLNKPAPDWFKTALLAICGIMALAAGLYNAVRLFQGKGAYITSRMATTRYEDKGFLGILFTLIWLGAGVLFITLAFFRLL